jgi:hypothetical protein
MTALFDFHLKPKSQSRNPATNPRCDEQVFALVLLAFHIIQSYFQENFFASR